LTTILIIEVSKIAKVLDAMINGLQAVLKGSFFLIAEKVRGL
jgi:hypothetical protein